MSPHLLAYRDSGTLWLAVPTADENRAAGYYSLQATQPYHDGASRASGKTLTLLPPGVWAFRAGKYSAAV